MISFFEWLIMNILDDTDYKKRKISYQNRN